MPKTNRLLISVPGLGRWLQQPESLPSCLKALLNRSKTSALKGDLPIAAALGFDQLAAAPLCALLDETKPSHDGYCLRFDPVHLLPDLTAVWLHSRADLDLSREAFSPLIDELAQMFHAEGIVWRRDLLGHYGLIQLDKPIDCSFQSIEQVVGRRLDEVLPTGPDQTPWRRMMNESQMIFHQYRSLDQSSQQGMGLWFWGYGRLAPKPDAGSGLMAASVNASTLSDEWRGLASWLGFETAEGLSFQTFSGSALIDAGPMDSEDALQALESEWIQPAWRALAKGQLNEITLIDSDQAWHLARLDRMAFWRRGMM